MCCLSNVCQLFLDDTLIHVYDITEDLNMAFLGSFLQYLIIFIILVAIAILGVLVGRALRKRKDAKEAAAATATATTSVEGETNNE